jgi:hypothetical protein
MVDKMSGDMQDGMLRHYLEQVKASDVNVEARQEKEPFDYLTYFREIHEKERIAARIEAAEALRTRSNM